MSTTTLTQTLQQILDNGNLNQLAQAIRATRLGRVLAAVKVVATGLTAAASFDITTAAFLAKCTVTGIIMGTGETLPPIMVMRTLRITASGTAGSLGAYIVTDAGGTAIVPPGGASAAVGIALLSDDGKTITFPNTVTAFTFEYTPRPTQDVTTAFGTTI